MITTENLCVDCGLPCLGKNCPYKNIMVHRCDICNESAQYKIEDIDLCKTHATEYMRDIISQYNIFDLADMLDIRIEEF